MRKTALLVVLGLGALLPAAGCLSMSHDDYFAAAPDLPDPGKDGWITNGGLRCDDFDVLWEVARNRTAKNGWRIDDEATNYEKKRIVTSWRLDLGLARGSGKRRRRFVDFEEDKDAKGAWKVHACTVVQRNVDIDDPLNPMSAKWRADDMDIDDASRVAYVIASQFREFGPSKEFERR